MATSSRQLLARNRILDRCKELGLVDPKIIQTGEKISTRWKYHLQLDGKVVFSGVLWDIEVFIKTLKVKSNA